MRSHFDQTFDFLDRYLPTYYVREVIDLLEKESFEVSSSVVRNVRTKRTTSNLRVLNALLKIAEKYKDLEEKITLK